MDKKVYENILSYLKDTIAGSKFENHVFSVGGCERDKRLGREIKDIDLVVDLPHGGIDFANWLSSKELTKGSVVVYENFGTAMFRLKEYPEEEIEVVHTRKECYHDAESRNPETSYGTIMEDCKRRDFTVNAFYHNISRSEDLDFTGLGEYDLKNRIIRACDDPQIIFTEDPLRILRAIRFSTRLGFDIDKYTFSGMQENVSRLSIISQERITDEFIKIVTGPNAERGILMMQELKAYIYFFPEIMSVYNDVNYHIRAFRTEFTAHDSETKLITFLSVVGHLIDKPSLLEYRLREMKFDNNTIKKVLFIDEKLKIVLSNKWHEPKVVRKIQYECKTEDLFYTLMYTSSFFILCHSYSKSYDDIYVDRKTKKCIHGEMFGYTLPINGNDVMKELNLSPSPKVKYYLDKVLNRAFEHPDITRDECIDMLHGLDSIHFPISCKVIKFFKSLAH